MNEKNIYHLTFDEIDSTQEWLRKNYNHQSYENSPNLLVSTKAQTKGIGRQDREWAHSKHSLAFSFIIDPAEIIFKTPLEMAVQCALFFKLKFHLTIKLKWPNDLMKNDKKCGGIICHSVTRNKKEFIIVGIGINLNEKSESMPCQEYPSGKSSLQIEKLIENFQHNIPFDFYHYLLGNRLDDLRITEEWHKNCCHLNRKIKTHHDKNIIEGIFIGIGNQGQAILEINNQKIEIFSGEFSLT